MKRFVEGEDRKQAVLLPEYLEDCVSDDNPVRVVDVFVEDLDLHDLGFDGTAPATTGRPSYHPSVPLKIYIYGYLNRIQSSRRLERETQRNIELMWLTGRLSQDFKTIADFRRDNRLASVKHVFVNAAARVNNRAENSHQPTRERERRMRGFRDPKRTQAFLSSFGLIRQHFALKRHLLSASTFRKQLAAKFIAWREFTEVTRNPSTGF